MTIGENDESACVWNTTGPGREEFWGLRFLGFGGIGFRFRGLGFWDVLGV